MDILIKGCLGDEIVVDLVKAIEDFRLRVALTAVINKVAEIVAEFEGEFLPVFRLLDG